MKKSSFVKPQAEDGIHQTTDRNRHSSHHRLKTPLIKPQAEVAINQITGRNRHSSNHIFGWLWIFDT